MITATGTPTNNRAIIDLVRGSRTPAWMERNADDIQQLTISTLEGARWVQPGDVIKEVAPDVFEVVRA